MPPTPTQTSTATPVSPTATPSPTPSPTELAEQLIETAKEILDDPYRDVEAIEVLDQALQLYPNSAEAYYLRGKAKREQVLNSYAVEIDSPEWDSGLVAAIDDITQAISLNPMIADYWYERGRAQFDRRAYRRALEDFNEAIRLNPNVDDYYAMRGQTYNYGWIHFTGVEEHVVEDFSSAIRLNPLEVWYYKKRAGTLRHMDEEWKAVDDYTEAIRLDPQDHELYAERAWTYRFMSDETYELRHPSFPSLQSIYKSKWDRAIEDYTAAIDLAPTHGNYYYWRGISYRELAADGDPARVSHLLRRAIEDYDQALDLGVDDASPWSKGSVYSSRAWAYTGLRDYEQAIRDFTAAIDLGDTLAYGQRGFVYAIMGLDEQAYADFNEAVKTDENFFWARNFAFNLSHHDSEDCFGVSNRFWPILCP